MVIGCRGYGEHRLVCSQCQSLPLRHDILSTRELAYLHYVLSLRYVNLNPFSRKMRTSRQWCKDALIG